MNLNAPEVAPLALWCINALLCGLRIGPDDVPQHFACDDELFYAVMDEISFQFEHGHPSPLH